MPKVIKPSASDSLSRKTYLPIVKEFKVVALRETAVSPELALCDNPCSCADYWREQISKHPYFDPERECFVVLLLNTRRRAPGHQILSIGTKDTILVDQGEVFRAAIINGAAAIVIMHNHPSGDPTPSEADISITRKLIVAGCFVKIEVLDHVIMGNVTTERLRDYVSLRELGYFYK